MNFDFTGLNLTIIGVGAGALILLIIILRFAHRPKKAETPTGLGLDPSLPAARMAGAGSGNARGASATAAPSPARPTAAEREIETGRMASERFFAPDRTDASGAHAGGAAGAAGASFAPSRDDELSKSSASGGYVPDYSPAALGPEVVLANRVVTERRPMAAGANVCPKCGGKFLQGEMEGPTLMIDGVAREDFQPLLSARECAECGYLELYTRPAPAES